MVGFEFKSFSLLWRATRDGFGVNAFHSRCDGKTNTLTVVKSTTWFIFGGYTAVAWSSDYVSKKDNTAFLFSLTNPASVPLKMNVRPGQEKNAVCYSSAWGPYFGNDDLFVYGESNSNAKSLTYSGQSYEAANGEVCGEGGTFIHGSMESEKYKSTFQTVEVEVFQIL